MTPEETKQPQPTRLRVVVINGKRYFADERLHEYRAVENPHDRIDMDDAIVLLNAAPHDPTQE